MLSSASQQLSALRNPDGGFPPTAGAASEPEPTAVAAIALDDARARAWLADHQGANGGFLLGPASLSNDSATPLCAIALGHGDRQGRALDYLLSHQAQVLSNDPRFPHDPDTRGWGWTSETFAWVDPTARALLALRLLRSTATGAIADGHRVLADRECSGGGWNYGNRQVLGTDLEPYLQTTAVAVLALQDQADPLVGRGVDVIDRLWTAETGGLGWGMGLAALRLVGANLQGKDSALAALVGDTGLLGNTVALGWATIALGPGWETLRIGP